MINFKRFKSAPAEEVEPEQASESEIDACPFEDASRINFPLRVNTYQREIIKRGSDKLGITMTQFIKDACGEYAKKLGIY